MARIDGGRESAADSSRAGPARGRRPALRQVIGSVARAGLVISVSCAFYTLAPLDRQPEGAVVVQLVVWLLVFGAVFAWQIHAVIRSPFPGLRAVEAVGVSVPLIIVLFASAYVVIGQANAASFTEPLTRIDAMYFTVTVFATVGFGDIAPKTDAARVLVTVQMIVNLVLVGVIAKVLFGAVQQRRQALSLDSTRRTLE